MHESLFASVLRHPLPVAVVRYAADGAPLDGNAAAHARFGGDWPTPQTWPPLERAFAQLRTHPQRQVEFRHAGLDLRVAAALEGGRRVGGFTLAATGEGDGAMAERIEFALVHGEDGLWEWDVGRGRMFRSARWKAMLGYAEHELEDRPDAWAEHLHPDDRKRAQRAQRRILDGETASYSSEHRLRHRQGGWVWVLDRGRVLGWDLDDKPLRIIGTQTDISAYKALEARLREHEQLLTDAQRIGRLGSWAWDLSTGANWWSEELFRIVGLPPGPTPDMEGLRTLFEDSSFAALRAGLGRVLRDGTGFEGEFAVRNVAGEPRTVLLRTEAIPGMDGRPSRLVGTVQDISERKRDQELSRRRNELLDRISQMGRIGGFEITLRNGGLDTGAIQWTDENYRIYGLPIGAPLDADQINAMYTEASRAALQQAKAQALMTGRIDDVEAELTRPDGCRVWIRVSAEVEYHNGAPYRLTGVVRDITEEREATERIERLAHFDTLTGLPNRFLFRRRAVDAIEAAQRHGETLALLFVDLDRFKNINDSLGHQVGDRLLFEIAGRLRDCVRGSDLVARQSGDEFLVLLRELRRPEDAALVARKMLAALSEPVELPEGELRISGSIGIALTGDANDSYDTLLRAADTAMYAAKEAGRNAFMFFSERFLERVQRRLSMEGRLRGAIERGELSLAFQPTLALADGRVTGVEALLRWTHGGETHAPAEFIPIAEENGEIVRIGDWALREACRQAAAWDAQGIALGRIAVNVSAVQLRDPGFAERVIAACRDSGWPGARLELELTESALMEESEALKRAFALFEAHGIALAVDDFGTGFSNLQYLNRFPVRRLKIDRGFVVGMLSDPNTAEVVQAVIGLGHALGLQVVAEGVETQDIADQLRRRGCDEAQGYLYARPLPPEQLADWLRAYRVAA